MKYPQRVPLVTDSYLLELEERAATEEPKAKAFETLSRYSSCCKCLRARSYEAAGYPPEGTTDGASLAVMDLGTTEHEKLQGAIERRFPDAKSEVPSAIERLTSGHCDMDLESLNAVDETKTVDGFVFDRAIGLFRGGRGKEPSLGDPKGPNIPHVVQGGLNAYALGRAKVIVSYLSKKAIGIGIAEKLGLRPVDRLVAEWVYEKDEWLPYVEQELSHLRQLKADFDEGLLSDRIQVDDDGSVIVLDPEAEKPLYGSNPNWRCQGYCNFTQQCIADGPGSVPIRLVEEVSA